MRPRVVLALTPVAEHALGDHLFGPAPAVTVCASIAEADELVSDTLIEADAVLLSPGLSGLTESWCATVRATGTRVVGVALDQREQDALDRLPIDTTITPDFTAHTIATAARHPHPATTSAAGADESATMAERSAPGGGAGEGSTLVVVGSKGAPGASECACSLAALIARRWPCVLVELDGLGGALDLRLVADAHNGSVLGLVRSSDGDGAAAGELLDRWLVERPGWPPVLLGAPDRHQTLPELARPGATRRALTTLTRFFPLAVVDLGFLLADGQAETAAGLIHREALVSADAVVLVIGSRELQLRAGFDQLDTLLHTLDIPPERLRVVLNAIGGPGSCDPAAVERLLERRLAEHGLALDARLPFDGRALKHATAHGLPLAARARSPYTRALERLCEQLFLPVAPQPRARKQRLRQPAPVASQGEEVALPWRT